ncbi:MAG: hypothetical protein Q7S87_13845 [Agitococcus sp.]|nr:hypothetical protein [Agitococcus sp.]
MGLGDGGHNLAECFGMVASGFFLVDVFVEVGTTGFEDELVGRAGVLNVGSSQETEFKAR